MKFSALYQSHDAMREPCFRMEIDGKTLENTPGARLLRIECELTSNRQAGMLCLKAALNPKDGHGAAAPQHRREAPVKGGFGVATPTSIRPHFRGTNERSEIWATGRYLLSCHGKHR